MEKEVEKRNWGTASTLVSTKWMLLPLRRVCRTMHIGVRITGRSAKERYLVSSMGPETSIMEFYIHGL